YPLVYESVSSGIQSSGYLKMSRNEDHDRQGRRFTAGGNGHDGRDPRDVEIERLPETENIFGSIFTFYDIERNEGEKGLVEGDGPTMVTGGPVASMATLSFVPKVQVGFLVEARFTNLNLE
nr:reverse transcriptase domain-containing protein [Tanacetum cinerariifolium]